MESDNVAKSTLLPAVWDVPEIFRKRLGRKVGRQRTMFADGHLLLVLHAPPGPEDLERTGRFFWRQPDGTWSSNCFSAGANAVAKHLDEYQKLIEELEQADDDAKGAAAYFDVNYRLDPVLRSARNLHSVLQEARELCPEDADIINFRDRAYQIERIAELLQMDGTPLRAGGSSGPNAGLMATVIVATTAGALTLRRAAWYARRRTL
ncbi:MAG: hypothetical protein IH958_06430 [Chloroflexi bacterium]|nr:hypothetical protein [Chloroflexota bacterium]